MKITVGEGKDQKKMDVPSRQVARRILFKNAFREISKKFSMERFRRRLIAKAIMKRSWGAQKQ